MKYLLALATGMLAVCLMGGGCEDLNERDHLDASVGDGLSPCPGRQVRLANGTCGEPCEGNAIRGSDGECHACGEHEVARDNFCVCVTGFVRSGGICLELNYVPSDRMGTRWHPDPDDDGIISDVDLCPDIYDPPQGDADSDKIGDACDPDFAVPVENGPITDLHAENVTPYGGWLNFRSPKSSRWGVSMVVAWSKNKADVQSLGELQKVVARGDSLNTRFNVDYGHKLPVPLILTRLEPGTRYYVAMTEGDSEGLTGSALSNVLEFTTAAAPQLTLSATYPRVWANATLINKLKARHAAGDKAFGAYRDTIGARTLRAANEPGAIFQEENYCATAGLLFTQRRRFGVKW